MKHDKHRITTRLISSVAIALFSACAEPTPVAPKWQGEIDASQLRIPASGTYTQLAAGSESTCALRNDGVVACWGNNDFGQAPPTKVAAAGVFTSVSAGRVHACALRSDGAVECWGSNSDGQSPAVLLPPNGEAFVQVDAGGVTGCALKNDGVIQCWGRNDVGQAPATLVAGQGTFTAVNTEEDTTCGLTTFGVIECVGIALGVGIPRPFVATSGSFVRMHMGLYRVCGTRADGVVQCAPNLPAPLGGTFLSYAPFRPLHECGITTAGVAVCQGNQPSHLEYGQSPATRSAASGSFTQIVVGLAHTCALRTDGIIECWGNPAAGAFTAVLPTATFAAPASVIVGQPIVLGLTNAQVPGHPSATSFTYAFDCGGGSGFGTPSATPSANCLTTSPGTQSVGGRVIDQDSDHATYTANVVVKSAAEGTTDLGTQVSLAPLSPDIRNALRTKLNHAFSALADGKTAQACNHLKTFISQVNAQRGKAIPTATADAWILTAQQLQSAIGC